AQQVGEHAKALALFESVTETYTKLLGPTHTRTLLSAVHQVRSLAALGRSGDALSLIDRAQPKLQEALGSSSPIYQRIIELRAEIVANKPNAAFSQTHRIFFNTPYALSGRFRQDYTYYLARAEGRLVELGSLNSGPARPQNARRYHAP
ncbi:MAG: hypothetical protein ACKO15_16480, partial [Burkholderiales bacterium]